MDTSAQEEEKTRISASRCNLCICAHSTSRGTRADLIICAADDLFVAMQAAYNSVCHHPDDGFDVGNIIAGSTGRH